MNLFTNTRYTVQSYPDPKTSTVLVMLPKQAPSESFPDEVRVSTSQLPGEVEGPMQILKIIARRVRRDYCWRE